MEKYLVVLLLQAVILALTFQSGLSIKCYLCNSSLNEKCGDPADKMNMEAKECSASIFEQAADQIGKGISSIGKAMNMDIPEGQTPKFACQKIKVVGEKKENTFIMRGCTVASSVSGDTCSVGIDKLTGGHGKVEYCGTCEEDYCNGSSRQSYTALLLMSVPCFAAFASRWLSI